MAVFNRSNASECGLEPVRSAPPALSSDEAPVDLRCSLAIFGNDAALLLHRTEAREWVLPGGRPRPGESMLSCARREVREETGAQVVPGRCAFLLEVAAPDRGRHTVELVFLAAPVAGELRIDSGEPGRTPEWVPLSRLGDVPLRPPVGGYLRALARDGRPTVAYLGNVWRPATARPGTAKAADDVGQAP